MVLRRRPDGPPVPEPSYYLSTPPSQRRRLPEGEFAERYGAGQDDIARVRAFADRNNLEVTGVSAARRTVSLAGTVEQVNRAFGVVLNQYRRTRAPRRHRGDAGTEVYRGREGFIHVPAGLVEIVVGVFGLDNRSVSHRNGADPPNPNPVPLATITQLYDFPANQATGQTIAIFSEGGYLASDISSNFGGSPPVVTDVPVNASNGNFADGETTQDIVISASVAPGATSPCTSTTAPSRAGSRRSAASSTLTQAIPSVRSCPRVGTSSTATTRAVVGRHRRLGHRGQPGL